MKRYFLHLADLHLDQYATLAGQRVLGSDGLSVRLQDTARAVLAVANEALRRSGDRLHGIVISGDLFTVAKPRPSEIRAAGELFRLLDETMGRINSRVLVIPGNHDTVANAVEASALAGVELSAHARVVERPGCIEYGGAVFACLPYPRRDAVRELMDVDAPDFLAAALRPLALSLAATATSLASTTDAPMALVYHGIVQGAVAGQQPRPIDGDMILPADVAAQFPACLCGHVHKQQQIPNAGQCWMAGSPIVHDYGEAGEPKGGILWTVEDGQWTADPIHVESRQWLTVDVEPDNVAAALDEWQALQPRPVISAPVYRIRGELPEADVLALRAEVQRFRAAGGIVQDGLRVAREVRDAARVSVAPNLGESAMLRAALESRGVNTDDAARLLALHGDLTNAGGAR